MIESLGLRLIHRLDPERAHGLAIRALNMGLTPRPGPVTSARLKTSLAGMTLENPVGLAAGFDKNARALAPLMQTGFGFLEVGAATPLPQSGNAKPRLFRLDEDRAAINRFGFNNDGAGAIAVRLAMRPEGIPVGINIGANKGVADMAADFVAVLSTMSPTASFATINVSSPNTGGLRNLQAKDALKAVLDRVMGASVRRSHPIPIFLKLAPDLDLQATRDLVEVAVQSGVSGLIATNTTTARTGLKSPHAAETGGLSGAPLFERSTAILGLISTLSGGKLPLIGVGGIATAEDAYAKIRAGASVVQLYTALVFQGFSLVGQIARGLDDLLARDGFTSVEQAVGLDRQLWAERAEALLAQPSRA